MFEDSIEKKAGKGNLLFVLLGPVFGLFYICFLPVIAVMTFLLALPEYAGAKKADITEKAGACMACHSSKDMFKTFGNNEKLSLFVSEGAFKSTVHGFLNCTDCHQKISLDSHPAGSVFASKSAFALEAAQACRTCHSDEQLKAKPNHAFLANKTNAPPCTECHGSHAVRRISEWKPSLVNNQYCLTCHNQKLSKTLQNGERISLFIDNEQLKSSVHSKHACSDCHTEFSRTSHPMKTAESSRKHSISVASVCSRCHADKAAAVKGSIHSNLSFHVGEIMISEGNLKAPVCTDCHGFHAVGPKKTYDTLTGVPCKKCHEEVFKVYSKSVHGTARAKGEHKAPLCFSCHFAHGVSTASMAEKIRDACTGCHKQVETDHEKWLPNAGLHLSAISCAACHSPGADRGIHLRLVDENTDKPFTDEQLRKLLGTGYESLSRQADMHGEGIAPNELWNIVARLNEKGTAAKVTFLGKMEVSKGIEAHQLALKKNAVKECENCHSANSDFFRSVTVAVVKADGSLARFRAKPEMLGSMYSFLPLRQFYVLGSTRLKVLDWLGILMVFGGMAVPIAHITLRVLTIPIREAKRMNKHRKEGGR